jgi:hypothetical protein
MKRQWLGMMALAGAIGLAQASSSPLGGFPPDENFDGVTAPALPAGWTSTATGGGSNWVTVTDQADSAPNSAFAGDFPAISDMTLDTPSITPGAATVLEFNHFYNLENTFDGAVLEISINGAPFADIVAAGGSFLAGAYNGVISTNFSSPIAGRDAWTGNSSSFVTTQVLLPPAASGQPTVVRFRTADDNSATAVGWWIDSVHVSIGGTPPAATVTPSSLTFTVAQNSTASDTLNIANDAASDPLAFSIEGHGISAPVAPRNNDQSPQALAMSQARLTGKVAATNISVHSTTGGVAGVSCGGAIVPWLIANPANGVVLGGANTDVTVSVNPGAGGLVPGSYSAEVCITTNDPTQTLIVIPVDVTVTPPPPPDAIFCSGFEDGETGACTAPTVVPGPWVAGTTGPALRYRSGGTSDDNYVYVFGGGDDGGAYLADLWRWDPASESWTQLANMPTGKQNIQGSYLDGKIYVPGGYTGSHITENAIYDIGTDTWSTGAPLPVAHSGATAAYGGKIYDFGGNGANTRVDVYDPLADTWTQVADFPTTITYGRAITAGDFIYYVGGIRDGATTADVWRYDPATDTYTAMASLQTARTAEELMTDGDRIYAVNGGDATFFAGIPLANTVEIYDITADTWTYGEPTLQTSAGPSGGKAGGKLMIMGGVNTTTYLDSVQISPLVPE